MKKELIFLTSGRAASKGDFLQHIYDMHHIPLAKGDTYNILFEKIITYFKNEPEGLEAANNWIDFQKEGQEDMSAFDTIMSEQDDQYATFDLVTLNAQ